MRDVRLSREGGDGARVRAAGLSTHLVPSLASHTMTLPPAARGRAEAQRAHQRRRRCINSGIGAPMEAQVHQLWRRQRRGAREGARAHADGVAGRPSRAGARVRSGVCSSAGRRGACASAGHRGSVRVRGAGGLFECGAGGLFFALVSDDQPGRVLAPRKVLDLSNVPLEQPPARACARVGARAAGASCGRAAAAHFSASGLIAKRFGCSLEKSA